MIARAGPGHVAFAIEDQGATVRPFDPFQMAEDGSAVVIAGSVQDAVATRFVEPPPRDERRFPNPDFSSNPVSGAEQKSRSDR